MADQGDELAWTDGLPLGGGSSAYDFESELPEDWRLLISADLRDEAYAFGEVRVWMDPSGALHGAADSGCSCPTPFAGITAEGTKPIREVADLDSLIDYVESKPWDDGDESERFGQIAMNKADLVAKVHRALRDADGRPLGPWRGYETEGVRWN